MNNIISKLESFRKVDGDKILICAEESYIIITEEQRKELIDYMTKKSAMVLAGVEEFSIVEKLFFDFLSATYA